MANAKPRVRVPKTAKKGEIITIKTLISHKMESGQRKDKKTGKKIPRNIINKFVVKYNGDEVFWSDWHPAISSNPYIQFNTVATESGTIEFIWIGDDGKEITKTAKITVN